MKWYDNKNNHHHPVVHGLFIVATKYNLFYSRMRHHCRGLEFGKNQMKRSSIGAVLPVGKCKPAPTGPARFPPLKTCIRYE
jgi:hypothetical protein